MIQNPVLRRELLMKMRIRKLGPAQVGAGVAILLLLGVIYYETLTYVASDPSRDTAETVWKLVMGLQYTMVCLVAPSMTANTISREKEQQTWEMLLFTRLTSSEIVFGKLLSRLAMLGAALVALMPLVVICFYESVTKATGSTATTVEEFTVAYLVTVISAVFFATCGMFLSWLMKRTIFAIMGAYSIVIGVLTIGTALVAAVFSSVLMDGSVYEKCPLIWVNPVFLISTTLTADALDHWIIYVTGGLAIYLVITALMLVRMITAFRPGQGNSWSQ